MTEAEKLFASIGNGLEHAKSGQFFGNPCYKIRSKIFICFSGGGMVFKLGGSIRSMALDLPGGQIFRPFGKHNPMREWIWVPYERSDKWPTLAIAAKKYVEDTMI